MTTRLMGSSDCTTPWCPHDMAPTTHAIIAPTAFSRSNMSRLLREGREHTSTRYRQKAGFGSVHRAVAEHTAGARHAMSGPQTAPSAAVGWQVPWPLGLTLP